MRRLVIPCLIATLLTSCATDKPNDPLQVTDTLTAATPATSPPTSTTPAGTTHPAPPTQHTAYDPTTHTLVLASGPTLTLTNTTTGAQQTTTLPSAPATLQLTHSGQLLTALPDTNEIARTDLRTAHTTTTPVPGGPVHAVDLDTERTAVALRTPPTVTILRNGTPTATADNFQGPAQLLPTPQDLYVLDRLTTALTPINPTTGDKGAGLRAGKGATNAVQDRYGRILTIDTRGQELLAFSTDPLVMKQRYPVPGAPYGLAYDPTRDLAWVTLTATNEIVGYDIAGGEPRERHRLPTITQPNSVAVDPDTGTLYIASANGAGYQVVTP